MTGTYAERLGLLPAGQEHVLQQESGKLTSPRLCPTSPVPSPCVPLTICLRNDIALFNAA